MSNPELDRGGQLSAEEHILDGVSKPVPLQDAAFWPVGEGFTYEHFQLGPSVLQLLLDTSEFRERALSYRGFKVGAGAWCLAPGRRGRALGYNVKVDDTDAVNIHAEDLVTQKADEGEFEEIATLVVIGPTQEDHASGKFHETLHPCGRCRCRLDESRFISDRTLFVSARPDFKVIQFASLAAIRAAHDDSDDSGLTTFRFPETPAILQPRQWDVWQRERPAMRVQEIDSSDFDDTVGLYLLQRSRT
jgi:cytidine deaminase